MTEPRPPPSMQPPPASPPLLCPAVSGKPPGRPHRWKVALAGGKVTPQRQMQPDYHANVHLLSRCNVAPVCKLFVIQIAVENLRKLACGVKKDKKKRRPLTNSAKAVKWKSGLKIWSLSIGDKTLSDRKLCIFNISYFQQFKTNVITVFFCLYRLFKLGN